MMPPEESDGAIDKRMSYATAPLELRAASDATLCELTHLQVLVELQSALQDIAKLRATLDDAERQYNEVILRQLANNMDLERECLHLEKSLQWEQNRRSRIATHGPDCYKWGPGHYECALDNINNLELHSKKNE